MLSAEKNSPCDATGVLALEEEGLGFAVLESEDLAITTNVKLALYANLSAFVLPDLNSIHIHIPLPHPRREIGSSYLSRVDLLAGEGVVVGTHIE
jgi:hypothetical protein